MRKVRKCNKFCKSTNLQIFRGLGEDDSWRYLKQKTLWPSPFKAKHQLTQECIDVTSQNFIKILSLETFPLKSNNSIYKITTPSYGVEEEIWRRMPRKFFSSTQFQRKRKSLVFFQSINFLWPPLSYKCLFFLLYLSLSRSNGQGLIKNFRTSCAEQEVFLKGENVVYFYVLFNFFAPGSGSRTLIRTVHFWKMLEVKLIWKVCVWTYTAFLQIVCRD